MMPCCFDSRRYYNVLWVATPTMDSIVDLVARHISLGRNRMSSDWLRGRRKNSIWDDFSISTVDQQAAPPCPSKVLSGDETMGRFHGVESMRINGHTTEHDTARRNTFIKIVFSPALLVAFYMGVSGRAQIDGDRCARKHVSEMCAAVTVRQRLLFNSCASFCCPALSSRATVRRLHAVTGGLFLSSAVRLLSSQILVERADR
jgi:hypothetical protein